MTATLNLISTAQKNKIKTLARQGCSIHEVGTALGFTQGQVAQILEDENHPFNQTYWQEKVKYAQRLRDLAMKIAETSDDDSVRAKLLEFLTKENSDAFENKRQHTGYTNIRKLLSLVRQQFEQNPDGSKNWNVVKRNQSHLQKEPTKIARSKEVSGG
jgi:predicted transcriptional regulator